MRLISMAVVGVAVGWLTAVCAQAQETLLSQALQRDVLFSIESGRVTLEASRVGNIHSNTSDGRRRETLSIRSNNGSVSMTYERNAANEKMLFDITSGDRARICRSPWGKSDVVPLEFVQAPDEKITLTIGPADHQKVYRAAGLWHLLVAHPEECKQHLIPLLELLRPDWKLAETAAKVEEKLLTSVDGEAATNRARWSQWVAQLGDDAFAKREAADRALRAADPTVLSYLRQLDFKQLDAEQQFRVRRIIEALSGQTTDDSPEQAAASLAGDPGLWLAMLGRPNVATRRIAVRQLTALLGQPVPVDPEADPATQQTQREQLRAKIEGM